MIYAISELTVFRTGSNPFSRTYSTKVSKGKEMYGRIRHHLTDELGRIRHGGLFEIHLGPDDAVISNGLKQRALKAFVEVGRRMGVINLGKGKVD